MLYRTNRNETYLNFIAIAEPFDGWCREPRNFASQSQILFARNSEFSRLNFLNNPWWFRLTQNIQHGISLAFTGGILNQQSVFAIVFVSNLSDSQSRHNS